jgi:5'-nucleotidase
MRALRILVCNDDGIDAPGLALLADVARGMSDDVWTVAPEHKWSAASHQITFGRDLALTARGEQTYACSGAPADCVIAALTILLADRAPDLVLAGINDKPNVGEDAAYSGTLAIAREATFHGIPAIALSRHERWPDTPAEVAALRRLLAALWHTRSEWAADACWLAVVLANALPAPLAFPRTARDKIGAATEVLERSAQRIVYRLRRGRPGMAREGDENAHLQAGAMLVVRQRWECAAPLDEDLAERWSAALADDAPLA